MNAKQTEIKNKVEVLNKELKSAVRDAIEPITKWLVTDVTVGMTTSCIYLVLATDETKRIDLTYYSRDCGSFEEGQLTTNIGAFGSFNTMDGNDVAAYYIEVGRLLSNKEILYHVGKLTKEYTELIHGLIKDYRTLSKKN